MTTAKPEAIVITGPTGSGKSELAVALAERIGGSVISADSRQVYREMDIGTAKPPTDLRRVPHFGLDLVEPSAAYSAGRFARDATQWIARVRATGGVPVIAGGTGLFIRALLEPFGEEPDLDPERRDRLRRYLSRLDVGALKRWLERLDPPRAGELAGEGGPQRLSRSLEVTLLSGWPHSWWLDRPPAAPALVALVCCLELPRQELYRRIADRFDGMIADGLLDEVRRLLDHYGADAPGLDAVGYSELARHLRGDITFARAVEEAKRNTRRFAKRQLTWFRHQLPGDAVRLDGTRPMGELVGDIVGEWERRCSMESDLAQGGPGR